MTKIKEQLTEIIKQNYLITDYPTLKHQTDQWATEKPLQGFTILDATPVFRNTITKYTALLSAGADLTIGISDKIPRDNSIVELLTKIGMRVVDAKDSDLAFDIVLDCAASFASVQASIGAVELTRSGVERYALSSKPVFVADSGRIKRIETSLGTGESYFRAMRSLGYNQWEGKRLVVCGSGKVGKGIIAYGKSYGATIYVVTDPKTITDPTIEIIDFRDRKRVSEVINSADAVVTATGVRGALSDIVINEKPLLANMGIEDEFGEITPPERVLNEKSAINFILEEPTHLKYIDATMALHNQGALYLLKNPNVKAGLISPPEDMEEELLETTKQCGSIKLELLQEIENW